MNMNDFYKKYKNKYVKTDGTTGNYVDWSGNNKYCGQCATLARRGLVDIKKYPNKPYGNGKDFVNIPGGKKVSTENAKDGDIVVYPKLTQWGHVGVYKGGKVFNQNPHRAKLHPLNYFGSYKIIRPKDYNKKEDKPVPNKDKPKYQLEYMTQGGNIKRFNSYKWDKLIMKAGRGRYNLIFEINCNSRQIYKYDSKKKKWIKDEKWGKQKGVKVPCRIIKKY